MLKSNRMCWIREVGLNCVHSQWVRSEVNVPTLPIGTRHNITGLVTQLSSGQVELCEYI